MKAIVRIAIACALALALAPDTRAQGRLAVVPEARPSAELERAVRDALGLTGDATTLHLHLGDGAPEGARRLDAEGTAWMHDAELADRIAAADRVVLSGGAFLDWYDALLADRQRVRFVSGLFDALRAGTHLEGRGGAAAFFARSATLPSAALRDREDSRPRNPRATAEWTRVSGLGLGPPGHLDAAALGGTPERWLTALEDSRVRLGWWLAPDTAVVYDFSSTLTRVVGPGEVLLGDFSRARRRREGTYGVRISHLAGGAAWNTARDRLVPAESERPAGTDTDGAAAPEGTRETARAALRAWLPPSRPAARLELAADEDTRWAGPDAAPRIRGLRLDRHRPLPLQGESARPENGTQERR